MVDQAQRLSGQEYLAIEDQALEALKGALLPGWTVLPHQRINLANGAFEDFDAIVRGPGGYRDTIVEVKLFVLGKTANVALKQMARFSARLAALAERTGRTYQPLLVWAGAGSFRVSPAFIHRISEAARSSGAVVAIFRAGPGRIEFVSTPLFFAEEG